ncbi:hypothetical protein [Singulisphaera acidiphila]|uniref:Uncharacterized protein n=1 Tax=Singulisphaera acidiphila (strain ATCC BAA-1392 / DSM 18658 / VKM B-2454 / MOB10) TaxID=886293 RepID=L0DNX8_SINAD|nr:hypothetical protein [Singulisphaera acidiphila]AGA31079.1 hypothetical protein Sinac_7024 [Singulisphaera acidiphila DSM 18658]
MLWVRRLIVMLAVVAVEGTSAHAQFNYPGGYGGWGWGGWGGGVGTVQGDVARGLGVFAEGAGIYNQQTAVANSINADTAMRWNQYVWEGQQEANRRYHERLARQRQGINQAREEVARRLRDNPEPRDVVRGDALNVALDELLNPRVYYRGLKATGVKVPGTLIRDIPFQYAAGAITVSVDQLTKGGLPEPLKAEPFAADRENLKELAAELRKQNEEKGEFDTATLEKAQEAIRAMRTKVEATIPRGTRQRTEAERYLKALFGLTRMLQTPAINVLLAGVEKRPEVTLAELLTFMSANNLRFGIASSPRQQEVNTTLFPLLVKARDEAAASLAGTEVKADKNGDSRPSDFFAEMPLEALDRKPSKTPAPPAPAPQ